MTIAAASSAAKALVQAPAGVTRPPTRALTGTKRPATPIVASAMASRVIEAAAASGQSRRSLTKESISIEIVVLDGPPSKAGVTKKPSESRKVKVAAVASPRAESGSSTRQKVVAREAPSPSLARSKAGSMRESAA